MLSFDMQGCLGRRQTASTAASSAASASASGRVAGAAEHPPLARAAAAQQHGEGVPRLPRADDEPAVKQAGRQFMQDFRLLGRGGGGGQVRAGSASSGRGSPARPGPAKRELGDELVGGGSGRGGGSPFGVLAVHRDLGGQPVPPGHPPVASGRERQPGVFHHPAVFAREVDLERIKRAVAARESQDDHKSA